MIYNQIVTWTAFAILAMFSWHLPLSIVHFDILKSVKFVFAFCRSNYIFYVKRILSHLACCVLIICAFFATQVFLLYTLCSYSLLAIAHFYRSTKSRFRQGCLCPVCFGEIGENILQLIFPHLFLGSLFPPWLMAQSQLYFPLNIFRCPEELNRWHGHSVIN